MVKPDNTYERGTVIWSVMEGDWEDLTAEQIAEVLDATLSSVNSAIHRIKRDKGWDVPRVRAKRGRKREAENADEQ